MTWTYDGDPTANARDEVRFLIGDTDTTDQQLSDEEIAYLLAETNNNPRLAAAYAAEAVAAKYARRASSEVGDLRVDFEELMQHYLDLADRLRRTTESISPSAGIFIGNDQEQRLFSIGMHDSGSSENRSDYDDFPGIA